MLERAADRSIVDGDIRCASSCAAKSELPGEWAYLTGFRSNDEQPPPGDEAIFQSLRRRQLVTEDGGMWRCACPGYAALASPARVET